LLGVFVSFGEEAVPLYYRVLLVLLCWPLVCAGLFFSVMIVGCIAREFEHIASFSDFAYCVFGG
jgi:hypothetical protein